MKKLIFLLISCASFFDAFGQCSSCGDNMGSYNSVTAYANCGSNVSTVCGSSSNSVTHNGISYNTGPQWQCTEYVQRYYVLKNNMDLNPHFGNARTYWTNTNHASIGLVKYANGGSTPPAPGDIIVSTYGTYGHIAIVTQVTTTQVTVIHQNWGDDIATRTLTRSGNTIGGFSTNYTVAGWVRKSSATSCGAPTSSQLSATNLTSSAAKLNCTVSGVAQYYWRYRKQSTTTWSSVSATTTNYKNITGLLSGTTYEFQVAVLCGATCSNWSSSKTFITTINCTAPTSSQVSVTNLTSSAARLNCTVSGVAQYDWQYRKLGTATWSGVSATTTNYKNITGLLSGTTYEFQAAVSCGATWSNWSSSKIFTTTSNFGNEGDSGEISLDASKSNGDLLKVFPNPTYGQITIENVEENDLVTVLNLNGQVVLAKKSDGVFMNLDLSELNNGTYMIQVLNEQKKLIFRLVLLK